MCLCGEFSFDTTTTAEKRSPTKSKDNNLEYGNPILTDLILINGTISNKACHVMLRGLLISGLNANCIKLAESLSGFKISGCSNDSKINKTNFSWTPTITFQRWVSGLSDVHFLLPLHPPLHLCRNIFLFLLGFNSH